MFGWKDGADYKIRGCGSASEFRRYISASRTKRQRQLRRHCILLAAAAACIVLFICFLVFGIHFRTVVR